MCIFAVEAEIDDEDTSFFNSGLIIGTLVCFFGGALGGAAGIGGGGIFVPTFVLGLGLTAHHAIPLSKVFDLY